MLLGCNLSFHVGVFGFGEYVVRMQTEKESGSNSVLSVECINSCNVIQSMKKDNS